MEINPIANLASGMAEMGQMLQKMTDAKLALDDKILDAVAEEQAAEAGSGIDTFA